MNIVFINDFSDLITIIPNSRKLSVVYSIRVTSIGQIIDIVLLGSDFGVPVQVGFNVQPTEAQLLAAYPTAVKVLSVGL